MTRWAVAIATSLVACSFNHGGMAGDASMVGDAGDAGRGSDASAIFAAGSSGKCHP